MPEGSAAFKTKIFCFSSKLYLLWLPFGVSIITCSNLSPASAVPVVLSSAFLVNGLSVVGSTRPWLASLNLLLFFSQHQSSLKLVCGTVLLGCPQATCAIPAQSDVCLLRTYPSRTSFLRLSRKSICHRSAYKMCSRRS